MTPPQSPRRKRSCLAAAVLRLAAAAAVLGPASAAARGADAPPVVERVVVAFKTHFDIGYTDMAAAVVERYRTTMVDQALRVSDENRDLPPEERFVWTVPGWPFRKILEDWPGQTAERRARVLAAFREGRFAVHALPFTTHTELLEPEDLVRGLAFASELCRSAGLPLPRDAKMTDVPSHSWILPTLLRHAGVEFLHIGCNAASSSPDVPRLFWWEGPDGSRLLTMYTAESYGTGLVPPPGWPARTWLALIHTGDNHGPPRPEELRTLLEEARAKLPGARVRVGRLSDFADAVLAEKPDLPVVRGDMPDSWIHGPLSDPIGARIARNVRPAIAAAEALDACLRAWGAPLAPGAREDAARSIAAAWEQSLLYGEHTWGGAQYWISSYEKNQQFTYGEAWKSDRARGVFRRLEESWAEHTAYIETAKRIVDPLLESRLRSLAMAAGVSGERVVVYNPLPWKRGGIVALPCPGAGIAAVRPAEGGQALPAVLEGGSLRFLAPDVPPGGYRTFVPVRGEAAPSERSSAGGGLRADEGAATIENGILRAALDVDRGAVRSLVDLRTGRELVEEGAPEALGQYLYERFDADDCKRFLEAYVKIDVAWARNEFGKPNLPPASEAPRSAASPSGFRLRMERSPIEVSAVLSAGPSRGVPHPVALRATLRRGEPYLDLELTLEGKPADPWPEAGWMCIPVRARPARFRLGRLGGLVDPLRDIVPGSNHHLFGTHSGLAVLGADGQGLGISSLDGPLVSLDSPGCWRYSRRWEPERPRVYINLFNNQWTTNFRYWNEGTWTTRARVWPLGGGAPPAGAEAIVVPSMEARSPLLGAWAHGPAGTLPASRAGVAVSRPGILLTAFGAGPDGAGAILRLWDQTGVAGRVEVALPEGLRARSARPVTLRGEPRGAPIAIEGGRFAFDLSAYAPASFALEP